MSFRSTSVVLYLCLLVLRSDAFFPELMEMVYPFFSEHYKWYLDLRIVPDVLRTDPNARDLSVYYGGTCPCNATTVNRGNRLTTSETQQNPVISFRDSWIDSFDMFLLCMIDPDAPSRSNPELGEVIHWLVGNIPGNNTSVGEVLVEYLGPLPLPGTGFHRYVFLLYQQKYPMDFHGSFVTGDSPLKDRLHFSIQRFADEFNLGCPVAINAFLCKFDESGEPEEGEIEGQTTEKGQENEGVADEKDETEECQKQTV